MSVQGPSIKPMKYLQAVLGQFHINILWNQAWPLQPYSHLRLKIGNLLVVQLLPFVFSFGNRLYKQARAAGEAPHDPRRSTIRSRLSLAFKL